MWVQKQKFPLGFNEGPLIILLILTPKLLAVTVAGNIAVTVLPIIVQLIEIPVFAFLEVELLRGVIYVGNIISKNEDDARVDCCDSANVYSVITLLTPEKTDKVALVKITGMVIVTLNLVESCSMR
jgi:hypothetical protein